MDILGNLTSAQHSGSSALPQPDFIKCSRKGCQAAATSEILWNNPKVHTPDRRKTWAACTEHTAYLQDFLVARGFWKQTRPLS
ncbi:acetone carboxylase [Rothia sp. CCM 9417]|uniref:acetone carboxylase n=1 Tax=unclassified Rothia (in: high G+C Gram-positive bacteria) TaxID=2689056 RepID=UPI003AD3F575